MAITLTVADDGNGTDATATIAGAGGGETVNIYNSVFLGTFGSLPASSLLGSRVGNGTVLTANDVGWYVWWAVGSTSGLSNIVYQSVESILNPIHDRILDAVKLRIDSIGFSWLPPAKVLKRWMPKFFDNQTNLPVCYVCPLGQEVHRDRVLGQDDPGYPVVCVLAMAANANTVDNIPLALNWRTRVSRALRSQRLAGVDKVYDCVVTYDTIVEPSSFLKNVLVSIESFRFFVRENRGLVMPP